MRHIVCLILIAASGCFANTVSLRSTTRLHFVAPDKPVSFFEIRSNSNVTAFCLSDVFKYHGRKQEKFEKQDPKEFGIVISPKRFVIKPHKKRKIQVFNFADQKPNQDTIYRVLTIGLPHTKEVEKSDDKSIMGMAQGSIGNNILIVIPAKNRKPAADIFVKKQKIYAKNTGNTTISLYALQCTNEENCKPFAYTYLLKGVTSALSPPLGYKKSFIKYKVLSYKTTSADTEWHRYEYAGK